MEVRALGVVELEGSADALEHGFGDADGVAAFEADVVLDAHAGEQRDLLAAQAGHASATAEVGQSRLSRGEPGPPSGQELADVALSVHASTIRPRTQGEGVPAINRIGRVSLRPGPPGSTGITSTKGTQEHD